MKFEEIKDLMEYEEFVKNYDNAHFMQSIHWGDVMRLKNFTPHYVVLKDNDKIVASALMLKKKLIGKYCYYYVPRGYVIDYKNFDLIKEFTDHIYKYAKANKAIFVKIDPDIKLHNLDLDGNVVGEENNFDLLKYLNKIGYKHMGFFKSFVGAHGEQPRYTFRLNLDRPWDEVYNGMHPTTRKILNKGNQYNLDIYKGTLDDIDKFYETMLETAERESMKKVLPISYFKNYYEILNKNNMSDLYVVRVKLADLVKSYSDKVDSIKKNIEDTNNLQNQKKKENLLKDLNTQLDKALKELEDIKKK